MKQITNAEYRRILREWVEIEKPYLNPEFRLLDLREILPLNRTYLSQIINAEYGCNFYQFVTNYRIEEAKRLMRANPEMKLQDIAEQSGFSSPVVFSRIFARETGVSPRDIYTMTVLSIRSISTAPLFVMAISTLSVCRSV